MDSRISARALALALGGWRTREPVYEALADSIRLLCLDNRIPPRTALPAEREVAAALGVSRTTVAAAYRRLRETGTIDSVRGSGSVTLPQRRSDPGLGEAGAATIDLQQASPPAWPGLAGVVAATVADATALVARSGYDTVGRPHLRELIAARYAARGIPTTAENIMITTGAQSAIHLLAAVLLGRADRMLIETPTYPHAADAFRGAGARLVALPVTVDEGWDLDRAAQAFARTLPVLAYLMPDFHNPTGRTMSAEERTAIEAAADRAGSILVIDETTAELDIDRRTTPAVFGGEAPVIHLGSLGKTVWGGLRVGWIRADAATIRRLVPARAMHDLGTPELEQAIAEALLPRWDEILEQRSHLLRERRDAVTAALRRRLPHWRVPDVDGGLSLWVELDAPLSSGLVLAARERGLFLSAGSRFGVDGGYDRHLRVPFTAGVDELERAVDILAEVWPRVNSEAFGMRVDRLDAVV